MCTTGMVDVIFADVAQPDQARIVSINAQHFLKNQGHFVISIKVGKGNGEKMRESVFDRKRRQCTNNSLYLSLCNNIQ